MSILKSREGVGSTRALRAGRGRTAKQPTALVKREKLARPGNDGYEQVESRTGMGRLEGLVARSGWRKGGELGKMALRKETKGEFGD